MSTGAIIAIAVIAAIILIALVVALPRMKRSAAERKLQTERRQRAEEHRSRAQLQQTKAELAEQEARKQRAEAEIHAKRAELHEHGLADEELDAGPDRNGTHADPIREDLPVAEQTNGHRDEDVQGGGRFRELNQGGRAHEPADIAGERRFVRREEQVGEPEHRTTR